MLHLLTWIQLAVLRHGTAHLLQTRSDWKERLTVFWEDKPLSLNPQSRDRSPSLSPPPSLVHVQRQSITVNQSVRSLPPSTLQWLLSWAWGGMAAVSMVSRAPHQVEVPRSCHPIKGLCLPVNHWSTARTTIAQLIATCMCVCTPSTSQQHYIYSLVV